MHTFTIELEDNRRNVLQRVRARDENLEYAIKRAATWVTEHVWNVQELAPDYETALMEHRELKEYLTAEEFKDQYNWLLKRLTSLMKMKSGGLYGHTAGIATLKLYQPYHGYHKIIIHYDTDQPLPVDEKGSTIIGG